VKQKIIKLAIIALVIVIGIPFVIHISYSSDNPIFTTHWGPEDIMIYLGAVLGGFATLYAVYMTIAGENKKRREESTLNSRVFILTETNIYFKNLNEFKAYSKETNISKLYIFRDWLHTRKRELRWITNPDGMGRFAAFIITNPSEKYIHEVVIKVDAVKKIKSEGEYGAIKSVENYKPISFTALPGQNRIAFALPEYDDSWIDARTIEVKYKTQMNERINYKLEYTETEVDGEKVSTATESYYINDEKEPYSHFVSERAQFLDLRKQPHERAVQPAES